MMQKLSLVLFGIILSVSLLEIGLRIFDYQKEVIPNLEAIKNSTFLYRTNTKRIYELAPNIENYARNLNEFLASDEYGFRYNPLHNNFSNSKSKEITIVAVGDSYTYGYGVSHESAYPAILEKILKDSGKDVIVHNAGVPGYGPDQEFIYIKDKLIPEFHPDIIIWNISSNNDIWDSNEGCLFRTIDDELVRLPAVFNTLYLKGLIVKKTPLPVLQKSLTVNALIKALTNIPNQDHYTTLGCTLAFNNSKKGARANSLKKLDLLLDQIKVISQKEEITIVLALVPFQHYFVKDLDYSGWPLSDYRDIKNLVFDKGILAIDANSEIAKSFGQDLYATESNTYKFGYSNGISSVLGITDIDVAKDLFLTDENFEFGNRHLNEEGNRIFAEIVADYLLVNYDFRHESE